MPKGLSKIRHEDRRVQARSKVPHLPELGGNEGGMSKWSREQGKHQPRETLPGPVEGGGGAGSFAKGVVRGKITCRHQRELGKGAQESRARPGRSHMMVGGKRGES